MLFPEADYTRFDFWAIVVCRGVVTIEAASSEQCREWLRSNHYEVARFDFRYGISHVVAGLGELLRWEEQFGYSLSPESRNLDALRDGYSDYPVPDEGGAVTIFEGFEHAWVESEAWSKALLSIASEVSITQLALGRRYFAVVEVRDGESPLIGKVFDEDVIGLPFSQRPGLPWR